MSNKIAMGGMKGLPGMPGSKNPDSRGDGGKKSKHGNKPPKMGVYKSNQGAGFNKPGAPGLGGVNAFNVPKYGSGGGLGGIGGGMSGIGGGIGGGMGLGSYGS